MAHIGWDKLVAELMKKGYSEEAANKIAWSICVKKYGKQRCIAMAQSARKKKNK
ncbi:MAG: hypothetical protein J7K29_06045 [Candidatus Cloacimonetes bacterium]|nr:hypothetical protein [Candidatus Cloacimonadota bacterium]